MPALFPAPSSRRPPGGRSPFRPVGRLALLCVIAVSLIAPATLPAADPSLGDLRQVEALQRVLTSVADTVRPSVVAIRTQRRSNESSAVDALDDESRNAARGRLLPAVGSGVVIAADGLILTNHHVVENTDPERITCALADGRSYPAVSVTSDPRSDLAVVRIAAADLTPIRMGDVGNVRQGHFVVAMGNPYGTASDNAGRSAMSFGVVSALGQELSRQLDPLGESYYGNLIQTDARINPGNSGGPLLNLKGELIGINTAIATHTGGAEGVGYAISIDQRVRDIIVRLARGETIEYGYLGVDLEVPSVADRSAAGAPRSGGALVREVRPGTPAAAARLQAGDVIVEYDGQRVQDRDHLVRLVGASHIDTEVGIVVWRDKRQLRLNVRPDRRPTDLRLAGALGSFWWRGMKLTDLSPANRRAHRIPDDVEGVLITQIDPNGPAPQAGIRPGQVLRQVGDIPIRNLQRLREIAPSLSGPLKLIVLGDKDQDVALP